MMITILTGDDSMHDDDDNDGSDNQIMMTMRT